MFAGWLCLYGLFVILLSKINQCLGVDVKPHNLTAIVLAPDELEEIEYATVVSILRRAQINVTTAGEYKEVNNVLTDQEMVFKPDLPLRKAVSKKYVPYNALIVVGGYGHLFIVYNKLALKTVKKHVDMNKIVAFIDEAPRILLLGKMCRGRKITCTKSIIPEMIKHYTFTGESTTVDGNLITSCSAATAMEFALTIVEKLLDAETADAIANDLGYKYTSVLRKKL